jgi:hypothetical protein
MAKQYKVGDKVHFDGGYGKIENGIVKSVQSDSAFVVYNCDNDWDNFKDYTGCRTQFIHLHPGWSKEVTA